MSEHHIIMDLMGIETPLRVVYHFETEAEMFALKEHIDFIYKYSNLKDEDEYWRNNYGLACKWSGIH